MKCLVIGGNHIPEYVIYRISDDVKIIYTENIYHIERYVHPVGFMTVFETDNKEQAFRKAKEIRDFIYNDKIKNGGFEH